MTPTERERKAEERYGPAPKGADGRGWLSHSSIHESEERDRKVVEFYAGWDARNEEVAELRAETVRQIDLAMEVQRSHIKQIAGLRCEIAELKNKLSVNWEKWNADAEAECWQENESLRTRLAAAEAVVIAARRASEEIQSQKVSWPGEVDTLMDTLSAYDAARGEGG